MKSKTSLFNFFILFSCLFFVDNKILLAQPTLYGTTLNGGLGSGIIFGVPTGSTNFIQQVSIPVDYAGKNAKSNDLVQASNGKFYAITYSGGTNNLGVLFEYDPAVGTYTKTIDFNNVQGYNPQGSLVEATNGKLYGMSGGGSSNFGMLFEYDFTTRIFTKKIDFNGVANGRDPYGSLTLASNGKLYGITSIGGTNNLGVLFEYDPITNIYVKKVDFDGTSKGSKPNGSLMQAANGKLYGMTKEGGTSAFGVLFEYDIATSTFTKKVDFNGSVNGKYPTGALMQASNGKLYGMTSDGGVNFVGVLFEYDPATSNYVKKFNFQTATSGSFPNGSLVEASNGNLYGMTALGGTSGLGVLFEYNVLTSSYTKKLDFNGTNNGSKPMGTLVKETGGKLFALTFEGGASNCGVLFEYDALTNAYTKRFNFSGHGKLAGDQPQGAFVEVNGKLYGTTVNGGVNDMGVLFEYDPLYNSYTKKIDFAGTLNGSYPISALMLAANGKIYGTASEGGVDGEGVLFEYNVTTNTLTKKVDFDGVTLGGYPYGELMQASNGKIYGTTQVGGALGDGVIFEYDINTNTLTKKIDFNNNGNGRYPTSILIEATPGVLYGTTGAGGVGNNGVLFSYTISGNVVAKKLDFNTIATGRSPIGSMIKATNGKLYGTTNLGGLFDLGILFEYDAITNTFTKKVDFDGLNLGGYPFGSLMQASNAKLYSTTSTGGLYDMGVLFEYDIITNSYTKKIDFNDTTRGGKPICNLVEMNIIATGETLQNKTNVFLNKVYPNPTNWLLNIDLARSAQIIITNALGQIIKNESMSKGLNKLNIENEANGVYFIKAIDESEQQIIKFVKEN